jgi:diguanylate cyclase (GGDEF)-like protein
VLAAGGTTALLLRRRAVLSRLRRGDLSRLDQRGLDALTGLPNRAEGVWWLNTRLARAQARGHRLALMILDLDAFAEVNAVHGRAVGDHVLQVTAARMQAQLRTGDMVCRAGNDTFMVIMDAAGPDHLVAQVGARVVAAVGEPITYHSDTIQVAASMGFAVSQDRDKNADLLLDRADRALIQAKSSTRPIVQF